MFEIKTIDDIHEWLNKAIGKMLYIAGAGDYGEYIGEYLNSKRIQWVGYIDKREGGKLNNKEISGYNSVCCDANYIVSSFVFGDTIANQLVEAGAGRNQIAIIKDRSVFGAMRLEANIPSHGSYIVSSGGDLHPDKTFMVMERSQVYEGIFCDMLYYLRGCEYAEKKGFTPVIDDTYFFRLCYQNIDRLCKECAWDYYFKQPGGYSLDKVKNSKNIRYYNLDDSANIECMGPYPRDVEKMSADEIHTWKRLMKKYMCLNDEIYNRIGKTYNKLFSKAIEGKVLGVSVREGYMIGANNMLSHNSIWGQPDIEAFLEDVEERLMKYGCKYVFVICQAAETIELFKAKFGDKVIHTNRMRRSMKMLGELESSFSHAFDPKIDRVTNTNDYIEEVYLLSKCDSLLCGWTHGNVVAYLLKDGNFEHADFYTLGSSTW